MLPHPVAVHSPLFPLLSQQRIGLVSPRTLHTMFVLHALATRGRERAGGAAARLRIVSLITQRSERHRGCPTAGAAHGTSVCVPRIAWGSFHSVWGNARYNAYENKRMVPWHQGMRLEQRKPHRHRDHQIPPLVCSSQSVSRRPSLCLMTFDN